MRDHCSRHTGDSASGVERVEAKDLWRRPAELRASVTSISLLFGGNTCVCLSLTRTFLEREKKGVMLVYLE